MVALLPPLTRIIAGISVPNTPLINSSIALARTNLPDHGYNHVMRAWLNGQAIINHLPRAERAQIDVEAFGVATILHDMGWAFNTSYVSPDKVFSVDGANAARNLIRKEGGRGWNDHRIQLVWDAIALHTYIEVSKYKEAEVVLTSAGTYTELFGPASGQQVFGNVVTVSQSEHDAIAAAFPRQGLKAYLNETMIHLCTMKPEATYNTFAADWGEKYVAGYTEEGRRFVDLVENVLVE